MKISPKIFTNAYDQAGARSAIFDTPKMAKTGYKSTFVCESDHIILFISALIFSHQERESGRGGDNQKWQIESIVTCAPIPLRVEVAFTIKRKPTVEARNMIVALPHSHWGETAQVHQKQLFNQTNWSFKRALHETRRREAISVQPMRVYFY